MFRKPSGLDEPRRQSIGPPASKEGHHEPRQNAPSNRDFFTFVTLLGAWKPALPQTNEPRLRVEVGTHHAGIMRIATDRSNRFLVTGCEDKTARVRDLSAGAYNEIFHILPNRSVPLIPEPPPVP